MEKPVSNVAELLYISNCAYLEQFVKEFAIAHASL
jgi:hypothetical protein